MVRNFTQILFAAFLIIFSNSCKKNTAEGIDPSATARYSFAGAPSGCIAPVIGGVYLVGRALDGTNTITLTVDVAVKGTYSIKTTAANGVSFWVLGAFTSSGPQTVVLTGTGTPVKAGNFSFVPTDASACNFIVPFTL